VNEEVLAHRGQLRQNKKKTSKESLNFIGNLTNETALNVGIMLSTFNKYYSTNL